MDSINYVSSVLPRFLEVNDAWNSDDYNTLNNLVDAWNLDDYDTLNNLVNTWNSDDYDTLNNLVDAWNYQHLIKSNSLKREYSSTAAANYVL